MFAASAAYQQSSNSSAITGHYSRTASAASWVGLFLSDLLSLKKIIFPLGLGLSTVLAFLYLYFLRIPGVLSFIIWTILISIQCLLIAGSALLLSLSKKWATAQKASYEVLTIKIFAYVGFAMSFLFFCFLLVVRKRISMAVGVIKETARALSTMPVLILMPIVQVLAMCLFLVPWFIYVIFLASSGTTVTATGTTSGGLTYTYRQFVYTDNTKYAFLYMLFVWFWTSEFIVAIGQIAIALSLVAWYFTKEKKKIGNGTVFWVRKNFSNCYCMCRCTCMVHHPSSPVDDTIVCLSVCLFVRLVCVNMSVLLVYLHACLQLPSAASFFTNSDSD